MKHISSTLLGLLSILSLTQSSVAASTPFIQEYVQMKLNLNSATLEELIALPGIGESKARAILLRREQKPFHSVQELRSIKGFGPKLVASLKDQLTAEPTPNN